MPERFLESFDSFQVVDGAGRPVDGVTIVPGPVDLGVVRQCPQCLLTRDYSATDLSGDARAARALVDQLYEQHYCQPWKRPYRRVRGWGFKVTGR